MINPLLLVGMAAFASAAAMRMLDPILPLIGRDFSRTTDETAMLSVVFTFSYAGSLFILGPIGDAFGKMRVVKICLAMSGLATVLAGLTPNFLSLFSMRLLAGFFSGGIIPLCLALVGDLVAINRRQAAISRFATATVGGQIFGAVLSGLFAPLVGWRGVMIGAGAFSMTCAILLAITARGGNDGRRPFSLNSVLTGYRRVFANPSAIPLYTIVCFEGMIIYGTFPYIAAILERQSGLGPVEAGLIVGAYGSGGLAFAVASGWLVGRLGPAHFFVLGGILMAIANFMLAFEIHWHILGVFFVGYGFGFFCFHSRLQTIATELSSENRGASVGFFASSLFVGVAIGPMLFSLLLRVFGETGALFATASAILILASAAIRMLR